jgi:hypothetical protein
MGQASDMFIVTWSTVDGLRAGEPVFDSLQGQEILSLHSVQTDSVAHPTSYPMGPEERLFPGVKRPEREELCRQSPIRFLSTALNY